MFRTKIIIFLVMMLVCICSACSSESKEDETKQGTDNKSNYLTNTFAPELYDILFEKQQNEYKIKYSADYYLTTIEGQQDFIYFECFLIYEKDTTGSLTNCKTVMITKPELNQRYMEEYLNVAYGVDYKYEKPFENVYVHVEDIMN